MGEMGYAGKPPGAGFALKISRMPALPSRGMTDEKVRVLMSCALTVTLVAVGLYVLIGGPGGLDLQRLAGGWIGTAVGYWLR